MGNGMNKVLPGLYIGSFRDSKDSEQLRANNITHIISIHDTAKRVHEQNMSQRSPKRAPSKDPSDYEQDKEYLCIQASDSPTQNLTQFFPRCNDFIHHARLRGGGVLIHCLAGVSRSVTIAVAYLMSITTLSWREALKAVRGARNIANPNVGFQKQLQEFELCRLREERKRMRDKFPDHGQQNGIDDESECRKLLMAYHSMRPVESCGGACGRSPIFRRRTTPQSPQRRPTPPPSPQRRPLVTQTPPPSPQRGRPSFSTPPPSPQRGRPSFSTPPSSPQRRALTPHGSPQRRPSPSPVRRSLALPVSPATSRPSSPSPRPP